MNGALVATLLRGSLSGNRWRSALAVACIGLGVALASAVNTLHASALDEIDRAARLLSGTSDLQVRGPRNGFDDALYAAIARQPAVAVASPVVELDAPAFLGEKTLRVIGIDPFRAARLQPGFLAQGATGRAEGETGLLDDRAAWLTPAAVATLDARVGDDISLKGPAGEVRLHVAGTLPSLADGGPLVVVDIAAAQLAFRRVGVIHRIDLRLRPGVSRDSAIRDLSALLPPGVTLARPDDATKRTAGLTRAYRVNLTALALMALFTGGFLVFSTLALQSARRRQEFALLRALGLTKRALHGFLALEGSLLGFAGAALGTVLGLATSRVMLERFGYDLGAGFFAGSGSTFTPDALALAAIAFLGIITATAAAFAVTRPLARVDIAQALKDRHVDLPSPPGGWSWAIALAAASVASTGIPPSGEIPVGGYLAIGLALASAVLAVSPASRLLLDRVPASDAPLRTLARAQVNSLPGHLSAMVSGIVVSVALISAMAIMVHSFRLSLDHWLGGVLEADFFARAAPRGDAAFFDLQTQQRIAAVPGVARMDPIRFERLSPGAGAGLLTVIARPVDATLLAGFQANPATVPPRDGPVAAWVSEAAVDLFGWRAGQDVTLPLGGRLATFRIAGTFRDYSRTWGALLVDLSDYRAMTGDWLANDIAIHLAPGAEAKAVGTRLTSAIAQVPGAELNDAAYIHARALGIFDRTFAATYALEAAAILIALAGVTSSFAALAWSRRREFGVLRHLGLARGEVLRMLALEGGAAGLIGAVLGLVSGAAVSVVLVNVVNRQSFHWGMTIHWPWLALAALSGTVVVLCALGAMAAGRAAVAHEAVHAVKDDA